MKRFCLIILMAMGILAWACTEIPEEPITLSNGQETVRMIVSADFGSPQTRTTLHEDGSTVLWSPGDSIQVFRGGAGAKFVSNNDAPAEKAEFAGTLSQSSDASIPYWAVYPYDVQDSSDGNGVTTRVPSVQKASTASFQDGASPAIACTYGNYSEGEEIPLSFHNISSGLKFSLAHSDITAVTFRGNAGENVAGRVKVGLNAEGVPTITETITGEKEIRMTFGSGEEFPRDTWFYLTLLPQTFSQGFTITFETATMTGTYTCETPVTFNRSIWKRAERIEEDIHFSFPSLASKELTFRTKDAHGVGMNQLANDEYELDLSGGDPYIYTTLFTDNLDPELKIVDFEYKYGSAIDVFQLYFVVQGITTESSSKRFGNLPSASYYKRFTGDLSAFRNANWGLAGDGLRFDPGNEGKGKMYVRNFVIREMTEEEKIAAEAAEAAEQNKQKMAQRLTDYLQRSFPSSVDHITVTSDKVTVEGNCNGTGAFLLAEITPWQDVTEMESFPYTTELSGGRFSITLDRQVTDREGINYDRVFSKWAVVKVSGDKQTLDSHARYADEVAAVQSPAAMPPKHKKGLAAGSGDLYYSDMDALGIGSITMNISLEGIVGKEVTSGTKTNYGGHSYQVIAGGRNNADNITIQAYKRGIPVAAILLAGYTSVYKDPENDGGPFTMPNLTTAAAFNQYVAALDFIIQRYNKPNAKSGRITNWIMHNEVDQGKVWTNMGNQPMERYLDRYIKSMRICYNIVRQYDQNGSVLASYTHCWTAKEGEYSPKEMLERTVEYSEAEGDFRWGVAYHPYPQKLTQPRFWQYDTKATDSDDSPYVTFKNPQVIDRWIRKSRNLYKGTEKRVLFFSENGTSSPSYSDTDLALQAAGACWLWKKIERLEGVDAIQWHNWKDNATEAAGGLHLGLRALGESPFNNYDPKPVWYVWQAAGSNNEEAVFAPYLPVVGLSSWEEIP